MHNIHFIRENPVEFDNQLKKRGIKSFSETIIKIDEEKRKSQTSLQKLQEERNNVSKEIGLLKSKKQDSTELLKKVEKIKNDIQVLKE